MTFVVQFRSALQQNAPLLSQWIPAHHVQQRLSSLLFHHSQRFRQRIRQLAGLFDAGGGLVGESHYGKVIGTEGVIFGLPTGAACLVPATTGTYYARVEAVNNLGQSDYHYVIEKR